VKQGSSARTKTKSNKFNHGESIAQVTDAIKTEQKKKKKKKKGKERNSSHLRTLKKIISEFEMASAIQNSVFKCKEMLLYIIQHLHK